MHITSKKRTTRDEKSMNTNIIKDQIRRSLNKLNKLWQNPILETDIATALMEIENTINKETSIIQYDGIIRQRFINHLAGDLAITDQRRDWFLYRAITTIIATKEMTDLLQKSYGEKYKELIQRFNQIGTILEELKYHYDMMEANPRTTDKYKYHDKAVQKRLTQLKLIQPELNQLLYTIATRTNLGQYTVPQQVISKLTQQYKKTEIPEERRTRPETDKPFQEGGL